MKTVAYFHDDNGNIGDTATVMGCHALMHGAIGAHYPISYCTRIASVMPTVVLPKIDIAVLCGGPWLWEGCLPTAKYDMLREFLKLTQAPLNIALGLGASYVLNTVPEIDAELLSFWNQFQFIACRDSLAAHLLQPINADLWPCPSYYGTENLRLPTSAPVNDSVLVYTALENEKSVPTAKYLEPKAAEAYSKFQEEWLAEKKPVMVCTWPDRSTFVERYSREPDIYAIDPASAVQHLVLYRKVFTARVHCALMASALGLESYLFTVDSRALTAFHVGSEPLLSRYPSFPSVPFAMIPQSQAVNIIQTVTHTDPAASRTKPNVLIVVSTCNRKDLTGQTLDSIARNKSELSDVLIIDDNSQEYDEKWLKSWGWEVLRIPASQGVGEMARRRYSEFLQRGYPYLCALDNDLLLSAHFDYRLLRVWLKLKTDALTVITGYRSRTQVVLKTQTDWEDVNSVGGAMQFTDRLTASKILRLMEGQWGHNWDHRISLVYQHKLATRRSLAQHTGIYGSGVNGSSEDTAVDFVGEGQW